MYSTTKLRHKEFELVPELVHILQQYLLGATHHMALRHTLCQTVQSPCKAVHLGIGGQPVVLHHVGQHFLGALGHQLLVLQEQLVHALREFGQGLRMPSRPISGQKMIVEQVHHHSGIAACVSPRTFSPGTLQRMGVRKVINGTMESDALLQGLREAREITAFHGIAHEVAHDHKRLCSGEVEVCKEIHLETVDQVTCDHPPIPDHRPLV